MSLCHRIIEQDRVRGTAAVGVAECRDRFDWFMGGVMDRRQFLRTAVGSGLVAAIGGPLAGRVRAAEGGGPVRAAKTPAEAIDRLVRGNARYVAGTSGDHDYTRDRLERAGGQKPFAAVVSCADSRVAPELVFDAQPGELFVCRDAGNFVTPTTAASLEYAVAELGVLQILVLGHSGCGAVGATIKVIESGEALPGHLPVLTDAITPAVERVRGDGGSLLANAIASNVRLTVERISTLGPIIAPAVAGGTVAVAGGVYDIATGRVSLLS